MPGSDLHTHTVYSDGTFTPAELMALAAQRGLDVVALTDHDTTDGLPEAETAFYFSGVTYATIGYGDVVLPQPWRLFGPVEGLTGILMCGLSAGMFFAVVNRIYSACAEAKPQ